MKLRSFLFGTAVAFAAVAPASAADLSIAEPVESVKVCDTFGAGFWYIPGSDTCLKIGGYVRFDTRISDTKIVTGSHSSNWDFRTRARLNITASSMTDAGLLTGFMRLQADYDPTKSTNTQVLLDRANLSLGGLLAGTDTSAFDYPSGGYNLDLSAIRSDSVTGHIQWTNKMDKFTTVFSLEDPRYRNGTGSGTSNGQLPDFVAAIGYTDGPFDARLSGAVVDQYLGDPGYAIQFGTSLKLDQIAKGDAIRFIAGYAVDAGSFTGASKALSTWNFKGGTSWNLVGSAQHYWAPTFQTAVMASYVHGENTDNAVGQQTDYAYNAAISALWTPYKQFSVGGELSYTYLDSKADPDVATALIRLQRDF
jgi:hypothetical protein